MAALKSRYALGGSTQTLIPGHTPYLRERVAAFCILFDKNQISFLTNNQPPWREPPPPLISHQRPISSAVRHLLHSRQNRPHSQCDHVPNFPVKLIALSFYFRYGY